MERWLSASNTLIESISSSHNSILTGASSVYENISIIPPLMANCPLASTIPNLSNPIAVSFFAISSTSSMSPFLRLMTALLNLSTGRSISDIPSMVVTIVSGPSEASSVDFSVPDFTMSDLFNLSIMAAIHLIRSPAICRPCTSAL